MPQPSTEALLARAIELASQQAGKEARSLCEQILTAHPGHPLAHALLAELLFQDGLLDAATHHAEQAYHGAPDPAGRERVCELRSRLAFSHAEQGDLEALLVDIDGLLQLSAVDTAAPLIEFLQSACANEPSLEQALGARLASILLQRGQPDLGQNWPRLHALIESVRLDSLQQPSQTHSLWINLTSRCNLRCVYCTVGQPGHVDHDIPPTSLAKIMDFVARHHPARIMVGCYTETTSYEGWTDVVRSLVDSGASVNVISNLARLLDDVEVETLARCATLQTSIDTIDRERLKQVRRGADIRTILYNIVRIRGRAFELGLRQPRFEWICVPTRENFAGLMEYVGCAIACGINAISINPVLQFQNAAQKFPDLLDFPDHELRSVFEHFEAAAALAHRHGIEFTLANRDLILERLQQIDARPALPPPTRGGLTAALGKVTFYARQLPTNTTRLCLQPWETVVLSDQGEVYPCTICGTPFTRLEAHATLEDAIKVPGLLEWKRKLLAGTPDPACVNCLRAPQGSPQELAAMVEKLSARKPA